MLERLIIVRDGISSYIGWFEGDPFALSPKPVLIRRARRIITAHAGVGAGRLIQQVNIFPIDEELGPVDIWVTPVSFYYPTEDATKRLLKMIESCKENEVYLRAKEGGIEVPDKQSGMTSSGPRMY